MLSAGEENRIGYFGEQRDKESDYFAMGFRLYDPEIGRFFAIDPLLDVQPSQTPYHYCFNNPTSFTDPTGLYPKKEKGDKLQAAVSYYWVIEEALQSLMNSRIQDEENWRMARSYRRNLFHLISDRKYYYGRGGGRTGTNGSGNGIRTLAEAQAALDNPKIPIVTKFIMMAKISQLVTDFQADIDKRIANGDKLYEMGIWIMTNADQTKWDLWWAKGKEYSLSEIKDNGFSLPLSYEKNPVYETLFNHGLETIYLDGHFHPNFYLNDEGTDAVTSALYDMRPSTYRDYYVFNGTPSGNDFVNATEINRLYVLVSKRRVISKF